MKGAEAFYTIFSPPEKGGERRRLGRVGAVVSRISTGEVSGENARGAEVRSVAIVGCEGAPKGGFVRGMSLVRGDECHRVKSAQRLPRFWILRLERSII